MKKTVAVLGAGSWGLTLAELINNNGNTVTVWEFNPEAAQRLERDRSLSFFSQLKLSGDIAVTSDIASVCAGKDFILVAVPSHALRSAMQAVKRSGADTSKTIFISATKGIENDSLKRMSQIIADEIPDAARRIVVLSGPTHAEEVQAKMPTAATLASINGKASEAAREILSTSYFRLYTHNDVAGVETGAALKNILAIAAGLCDGIGLGDNTKAALVTRGLREIIKLGVTMGGQPTTFFGLTGLGDLIVTCFSRHSRNRALGERLGRGENASEAEKQMVMVAEGVKTAKSAYDLAKKYQLDLPIMNEVYCVLFEAKDPRAAVQELMAREAKPESMPGLEGLVL
jgi:glycerol-3-phosphate dehydrogenase (NAD(P)+)